ncbi:hypothetical protein BD769DRAFT_1413866, partial [Suillus cothurnatus]
GLIHKTHNYYYPTSNPVPSTCTYGDSQSSALATTAASVSLNAPSASPTPAALILSMHNSLLAAGSIATSYHSSPSSYIVINFNVPSSSLPPSAHDLVRLSDAHANRFETVPVPRTNPVPHMNPSLPDFRNVQANGQLSAGRISVIATMSSNIRQDLKSDRLQNPMEDQESEERWH